MISCREHCSSATSVDSKSLFLRLCNSLQATCLCTTPFSFPPLSFLLLIPDLFFQGRERESAVMLSLICTSWESQGADPLQPQPWPWATAGCCHFTPATFLWICSWPLWGFQHTVYMTFLPELTLPAISYVLPFHEFMIIEQNPPPSKWAVGEIWSFM